MLMRALLVLVVVIASVGSQLANEASGGRQPPGRYVVVPGDSLSLIARRYGVSLRRLVHANRLDLGAPLLVGTVLRLPGSPPSTPSAHAGWTGAYVVQPGDTLGAIAQRYDVPLDAIARANSIDPAHVLVAGARLAVPAARARLAGPTITVQPGDTLSGIAGKYGISLADLATSNHIDPNALLLVGQRLVLPTHLSITASLVDLAATEASPYAHSEAGFDVSYPDCVRSLPSEAGFMIVGLNNGRPFTSNPCFETEYAIAKGSQLSPSIYLNAAYAPSLVRHVTSDCASAGAGQPLRRREQLAYAVGCSEAEASIAMLGGLPTAMIWIDIEPANTWSKHPALNRATIFGFVRTLAATDPRPIVGVYSGTAYWGRLTGGWSSFPIPEWISTGSPVDASGCAIPFAAGPVWLSQHATTHDHDRPCQPG
jgi:LysM repeat protein